MPVANQRYYSCLYTKCNRPPGVSMLTIEVLDAITTVILDLHSDIQRGESERCDGAVSFEVTQVNANS